MTWTFNEFISMFILPIGIHALSLVFSVKIYLKNLQTEKIFKETSLNKNRTRTKK